MPLYVYHCSKCMKVFELIIPLSKYNEPVKCKYCGTDLEKFFTPCLIKVN
jgi:putative FmdB family regulatory protein